MKKIATIMIVVMLPLIFYSCDPEICNIGYIENRSSGSIYLMADTTRIDTLQAGQTKTIGPVCGLGDQATAVYYYYQSVRNKDTFCRKDIRFDTNWTNIQMEKYKWQHRFTVSDSDF